jgi:hypothetical protein
MIPGLAGLCRALQGLTGEVGVAQHVIPGCFGVRELRVNSRLSSHFAIKASSHNESEFSLCRCLSV